MRWRTVEHLWSGHWSLGWSGSCGVEYAMTDFDTNHTIVLLVTCLHAPTPPIVASAACPRPQASDLRLAYNLAQLSFPLVLFNVASSLLPMLRTLVAMTEVYIPKFLTCAAVRAALPPTSPRLLRSSPCHPAAADTN